MMVWFLCVGIYYKIGMVWMCWMFYKFVSNNDILIVCVYNFVKFRELFVIGFVLCVEWSFWFFVLFYDSDSVCFLYIICDLCDVLIFGVCYYLNVFLGNEKFLCVLCKDLNGVIYQEYMNILFGFKEQMLFEMENKYCEMLYEMLIWFYGYCNVVDFKFEDLIVDVDCLLFCGVFEEMVVEGWDIDGVVQYYWDNSLFGGIVKVENCKVNV